MDWVRNDEVRRRTGDVKELAERAEQGLLRWFGHVERMKEECLVKITTSNVRAVRPNVISNGTDGQCEESVRYERNVCGARKSDCA